MTTLKRKITTLLFIILFIILAPIIVFYAIGNVWGDGWSILPTGGIFLKSMEIGSNISINGKQISTINFFNRDYYIKNLKPGIYSIVVKKDGYNEWNNNIEVLANRVSESKVFILPTKISYSEIEEKIEIDSEQSTTSKKIYKANPDYEIIANLFEDSLASGKYISSISTTTGVITKYALGTKENPIKNRHMSIWKDAGDIFIGWSGNSDSSPRIFCDEDQGKISCVDSLIIQSFKSKVKSIDFFPGESEVVIVAVQEKVFAIEAEKKANKKLQIIYSGSDPDFRVSNDLIYIKDNNYFRRVEI